jgi:hypothetical protein
MVFALPVHQHGAAFVHGARRQHITRQRGSRAAREATEKEIAKLDKVFGAGKPAPRELEQSDWKPDWDKCAWYQPIHYFGENWGIFIKEECVKCAAFMIARFVEPSVKSEVPLEDWFKALYRAGIYMYFLHEYYHHKIECLGFRLHVVERKSAYLPYNKLVYAQTIGKDNNLEEALANADCYRRLNTQSYAFWLTPEIVTATERYLLWQFPRDPPGYRKAVDYLTTPSFADGENCLQAQVKEASLEPAQRAAEWDMAPCMTRSFFSVTSDIWTVIPEGTRSRLPLKPIDKSVIGELLVEWIPKRGPH